MVNAKNGLTMRIFVAGAEGLEVSVCAGSNSDIHVLAEFVAEIIARILCLAFHLPIRVHPLETLHHEL